MLIKRIVKRWWHFVTDIEPLTILLQTEPAILWMSSDPGDLGILVIREEEGQEGLRKNHNPAPFFFSEFH